jgi:hypothetical protein
LSRRPLDEVELAAQLLAAERDLSVDHVRDRMRAAASHAGIPVVRLARLVIEDRCRG